MPRMLASGYPSSPFSLLHSGQCPDMSYSGGFSPGVPPLPIPNREVKPGRADGTAPQCGRVGRRLLSGEPSRKRGGSCFLCSFSIFFQILRRGEDAPAEAPRPRFLGMGGSRCRWRVICWPGIGVRALLPHPPPPPCRTPRVRQGGGDGYGYNLVDYTIFVSEYRY